LAWQALFAIWIAYSGAIMTWQGALAALISVASCVALWRLHVRATTTEAVVAAALDDGLGKDYAARMAPGVRGWLGSALEWSKILLPFPVRHGDVVTKRNIVFHREGRVALKLDVHRRRDRPSRCPTLVYVHGGGWVIGQRRYQGLPLMKHLAARGWVCISVDYRLSPRATFPDHIVDVKRAIAWARAHAAEHGGDPDFMVLCGNSAGAHLAALAALTPNDPELQPGFEQADTAVRACLALYGIYDFTDHFGHHPHGGLAQLLERHVMKVSIAAAPDAYAKASPVHRVHAEAPPFMVVHGDRDTLAPTDESRRFCEALRAKTRAPVVYAEIPHAQHAFEIFPSPRTAHFLTGATSFLGYVYSRHLESRAGSGEVAAQAVAVAAVGAHAAIPSEPAPAIAPSPAAT
jgi:acetyl esterase/lipase